MWLLSVAASDVYLRAVFWAMYYGSLADSSMGSLLVTRDC